MTMTVRTPPGPFRRVASREIGQHGMHERELHVEQDPAGMGKAGTLTRLDAAHLIRLPQQVGQPPRPGRQTESEPQRGASCVAFMKSDAAALAVLAGSCLLLALMTRDTEPALCHHPLRSTKSRIRALVLQSSKPRNRAT